MAKKLKKIVTQNKTIKIDSTRLLLKDIKLDSKIMKNKIITIGYFKFV